MQSQPHGQTPRGHVSLLVGWWITPQGREGTRPGTADPTQTLFFSGRLEVTPQGREGTLKLVTNTKNLLTIITLIRIKNKTYRTPRPYQITKLSK